MSSREKETASKRKGIAPGRDGALAVAEADDPVLAHLGRAGDEYRAARAAWEQEAADARQAREEAADAREAEQAARDESQRLRSQLEAERQRSARQRERADRLAAALKDVHRALFGGNVFDLILKACLTLTGATRGLYLVVQPGAAPRARAAAGLRGYPNRPASDFVRALCDRVLKSGESFVANDPAELKGLPKPDGDESLRNCLVAPAVLMRELNGVVLLTDKPGGFDRDDVDVVLSVGDQAGVAVENLNLQSELLRAYFSVVGVLADAMEAKDPYTHGHCEMVARLARRTAARLSDSETVRSVCCYGGLLHDVGKIGVSDGVLNKPGKLLPEEWDLMRSHVRIGRDLLANVPALDGVSDVVLHHHERFDGNGYPAGLAGEGIPLAARIVCVVDAYSAMTAKRSYKDSSTPEEARAELVRCKGTHFDPAVVDAFLAVLDDPEANDECADGCGLLPQLEGQDDFHHVLRAARGG